MSSSSAPVELIGPIVLVFEANLIEIGVIC
jgi:hypothetical protein